MTAFWNVMPREFLDDSYSNFKSFPTAFLTLFKGSTGESWNALMHELMQRPDSLYDEPCSDNVDPALDTCGIPGFAALYMLSFQMIVSMVILNICVAVVLEHFEEQRHEREREVQLAKFKRVWARCARRHMRARELGLAAPCRAHIAPPPPPPPPLAWLCFAHARPLAH